VGVIAGKKTIYKSITLSEPTVTVAGNNAIAPHLRRRSRGGRQAEFTEDRRAAGPGEGRRRWKLLARQAFRT
jgi:hypothetical protein